MPTALEDRVIGPHPESRNIKRLNSLKSCLVILGLIWLSVPMADSMLDTRTSTVGAASPEQPAERFQMFDGTLYMGKPDLSKHGLKPVKIVYHADLWGAGQDDSKPPDPVRIRHIARLIDPEIAIGVVDVEHWPLKLSDGRVDTLNLGKLRELLLNFKKSAPNALWGYYGIPKPDYWRAMRGIGSLDAAPWMTENDMAQTIVDSQDAAFPSLYTFYADREGWVKYAVAQIAEARRLAKGKPVYVFLWPQYHESNHINGLDYLKGDYWRLELETVQKYADGAILWGGYQQAWNEQAEWWTVTKKFLKSLK